MAEVNAYVFIDRFDDRPSTVLGNLIEKDGVRFSGRFVGAFVGFAAVDAPDLETLQSWIDADYWDAGLRCDWSVVVSESSLALPKRGSPDYCALVRVAVRDDLDPETVLGNLDDRYHDTFEEVGYGAAVVTGYGYDLLVELGADDLPTLWDRVRDLRGSGDSLIGRTATAVAYLPGNALRRP